MLKKDENALSMIYTVRQGCDQNESVWSGYKPFVASYGMFTVKLPVIEQYLDKQVSDIRGHAMDKEASRQEVTETAFQILSRLSSYAKSVKNNTLLKTVDYTRTQLNSLRDTTLTGACNILIKSADDNLTALSDYEITKPLIDQFQASVDQYQALVASPRLAISERKTAGGLVTQHIREAKLILKGRVDVDVEYFKTANPEFYSLYKNARNIPDYGTRKKGQKETVINGDCVDFKTHNALRGMTVKSWVRMQKWSQVLTGNIH